MHSFSLDLEEEFTLILYVKYAQPGVSVLHRKETVSNAVACGHATNSICKLGSAWNFFASSQGIKGIVKFSYIALCFKHFLSLHLLIAFFE